MRVGTVGAKGTGNLSFWSDATVLSLFPFFCLASFDAKVDSSSVTKSANGENIVISANKVGGRIRWMVGGTAKLLPWLTRHFSCTMPHQEAPMTWKRVRYAAAGSAWQEHTFPSAAQVYLNCSNVCYRPLTRTNYQLPTPFLFLSPTGGGGAGRH